MQYASTILTVNIALFRKKYHFVEINKMIESRVSSGFASGLGFFNNLEEVSPFCIAER